MRHYPVFVRLAGLRCLVVGGGPVAARKAVSLLEAGGVVDVISPALEPTLSALAREGKIGWRRRTYEQGDLEGFFLVIATTDDAGLNARVAGEARERRILVNVVDDPAPSTFIVPAVLERGPLTVAVSTSGLSPLAAARIRDMVGGQIGEEFGRWVRLLGEHRRRIIERTPPGRRRRILLEALLSEEVLGLLRDGRDGEAWNMAERLTTGFEAEARGVEKGVAERRGMEKGEVDRCEVEEG
ncbi:MAG: bifunctional precorrin-2 dehydrogenase/sirohydrochlorin ferrochelatase [Firmicutes bacterium]|nr:bifunctional precorrin-2 dehydrogenase/sirohydrochlorin ferrochelatase [Bacillota bacterium]